MADERSVVITLKLDTDSDQEAAQNPTNTQATQQKNEKGSTAKVVAIFAAKQAVETIVSEGMAWGEYQLNKQLTLVDDYIGQRNKNIAMTQINRGIGVASTITSMAATGAQLGGPWGAAIGAIIGAGVSAAGIARSNIQGQQQEDIMLRQMNAQLDFTRSRAGWSLKAASIGEDL